MEEIFASLPVQIYHGVPCYSDNIPLDIYADKTDLSIYLARYQKHLETDSIYENCLLRSLPAGSRVLSIGEGTGEVLAAYAKKYPELLFYGFDIMANRVVIAQQLINHLELKNICVYIGSVEHMPFLENSFQGVMERGVFHILPEPVKQKNLREIEKVCYGKVVMTHMSNARLYLAVRATQSVLFFNSTYWKNAIITYRMIPSEYNTLHKMADYVETLTNHQVDLLFHALGDRDLSHPLKYFTYFQYLGGLSYFTN